MNKRPIDRSKKSNIKCDHCKYWTGYETIYSNAYCLNENSPRNQDVANYWNRCKCFEWKESEDT